MFVFRKKTHETTSIEIDYNQIDEIPQEEEEKIFE